MLPQAFGAGEDSNEVDTMTKAARKKPISVEEATKLIASTFALTDASRLPKHARLYDAIASNIDAGRLLPGQKLPGERELCPATGVSLGTVQKGLGKLVTDGRIQREHGRGTFVRAGLLPMTDMWHYRFRHPETGLLLPVFAHLTERVQVVGDPTVREALGDDKTGYVRVCRIINIDDRFRCWSEMHLPHGRFGALLTMPRSAIESINLKNLLAKEFNAPTLAIAQTVLLGTFSREVAQQVGVRQNSPAMQLQIVGTSTAGMPITFQRIHVPASGCEMEIGGEASTTAMSSAAA